MGKKIEVKKGDGYGQLTIIEEVVGHRIPSGDVQRRFKCLCECGEIKNISLHHLRNGAIKSCGCLLIESAKTRNTSHGLHKTRQYNIWQNIKSRCNNVKNAKYKNYGGRGITYDKKWETFENFWKDMKFGYDDTLSIDRIDNDGNYCKENCRWATNEQQSNNMRSNVKFRGELSTKASLRLGGKKCLVANRILRGWSKEKAFTTPKIIIK